MWPHILGSRPLTASKFAVVVPLSFSDCRTVFANNPNARQDERRSEAATPVPSPDTCHRMSSRSSQRVCGVCAGLIRVYDLSLDEAPCCSPCSLRPSREVARCPPRLCDTNGDDSARHLTHEPTIAYKVTHPCIFGAWPTDQRDVTLSAQPYQPAHPPVRNPTRAHVHPSLHPPALASIPLRMHPFSIALRSSPLKRVSPPLMRP